MSPPQEGNALAVQASYGIIGDQLNTRWHPEDQNVDTHKIAGLTTKDVTLANGSTCRYKRLD
jgi:hypothetical protein